MRYNLRMTSVDADVRTLAPEDVLVQITRRIVEAYDPDKIILYGSHAYGQPRPDSDFDLLIIKETTETPRERWRRVRKAVGSLHLDTSVEPIVVTRDELSKRLRYGDQFYQTIVSEGKTLYDRDELIREEIAALVERIQPMHPDESPIPGEWYAMAERDYGAARVLFRDKDEFLVPAGVLLQQAVEKYLKGYLLSKGWKLVRTHDLNELLDSLGQPTLNLDRFRDTCLALTKLYLENRYSLATGQSATRAELERLFSDADALIARIRSLAGT